MIYAASLTVLSDDSRPSHANQHDSPAVSIWSELHYDVSLPPTQRSFPFAQLIFLVARATMFTVLSKKSASRKDASLYTP